MRIGGRLRFQQFTASRNAERPSITLGRVEGRSAKLQECDSRISRTPYRVSGAFTVKTVDR
jgi:hypothetical protein